MKCNKPLITVAPTLGTHAVNLTYLQSNYAPLASPSLTGTPTVPTASVGTNSTQIASTAFTVAEIGSRAPTKTGTGASGSWGINVTGSAATLATARNISLTGIVTASAVAFNGGSDISLTTAIADSALTIAKTSGLQAALDGKIASTAIGAASGVASLTASSVLTSTQFPAMTGDVTNTAGQLSNTISAGAVTLAKMANLAAGSLIGNTGGSAAVPAALTFAQVATALPTFSANTKGLVTGPASITGTKVLFDDGTWAVPAGGGSGSPGGSSGQLQYNNGGAFAGANGVDIVNGCLWLDSTVTEPVAPAGGHSLFSRDLAGRHMLAFVGPSGLDTAVQPHLGRNRATWWMAIGNATTVPTVQGGAALTAVGTATAANIATTNFVTWIKRIDWLVTTAAATAVAGYRAPAVQWGRGNLPRTGGFHLIMRGGPATGCATTTTRYFMGMTSSTAAAADVEPTTLGSTIGIGWGSSDTQVNLIVNSTKTPLGADFPIPRTDRSVMYELILFAPPNGTWIGYQLVEMASDKKISGVVSTGLMANTVLMAPRAQFSVGGTSSVVGITLSSLYIETDY